MFFRHKYTIFSICNFRTKKKQIKIFFIFFNIESSIKKVLAIKKRERVLFSHFLLYFCPTLTKTKKDKDYGKSKTTF